MGVLLLIIIILISQSKLILFSPNTNSTNYEDEDKNYSICIDSDADTLNQYQVVGNVFYAFKGENCSWNSLNHYDLKTLKICAFSYTYNDFCMDNHTLYEKTCVNNNIATNRINCNCRDDRCIEPMS